MDDTTLVISAVLIPRFTLQWVPDDDRDRVIQLLKTEVPRLPRREHNITSVPPATGVPEDFFGFEEEGHGRRDSEAQDVMLYLQSGDKDVKDVLKYPTLQGLGDDTLPLQSGGMVRRLRVKNGVAAEERNQSRTLKQAVPEDLIPGRPFQLPRYTTSSHSEAPDPPTPEHHIARSAQAFDQCHRSGIPLNLSGERLKLFPPPFYPPVPLPPLPRLPLESLFPKPTYNKSYADILVIQEAGGAFNLRSYDIFAQPSITHRRRGTADESTTPTMILTYLRKYLSTTQGVTTHVNIPAEEHARLKSRTQPRISLRFTDHSERFGRTQNTLLAAIIKTAPSNQLPSLSHYPTNPRTRLTDWPKARADLDTVDINTLSREAWSITICATIKQHSKDVVRREDQPHVDSHLLSLWDKRRALVKRWRHHKHNIILQARIQAFNYECE
ncbi:hypothetical protein HPB47_020303 [Ixodes persulcatus]|uniref:Uncharacterized protein n=1 Tax=Ixodes persulcatus TaxID=34615 RepID=A0AC60QGR5_IXOPE|nr:hypothetical protein HPB47_020303 [Ixodes persulcatus]